MFTHKQHNDLYLHVNLVLSVCVCGGYHILICLVYVRVRVLCMYECVKKEDDDDDDDDMQYVVRVWDDIVHCLAIYAL